MKFAIRDLLLATVIITTVIFLGWILFPSGFSGPGSPAKGTLLPNSPAPAPITPKK